MVIFLKINTLLAKAKLPLVKQNHTIQQLSFCSKDCTKNTLFICLKDHPEEEIIEALKHGVSTIVSKPCKTTATNHIFVDSPRKSLAILAKHFYHNSSRKIRLVGVTGTNGKTTTSTLAYHFFNSIGKKSMLIGSNGIFWENNEKKINNTTPDILTIYEAIRIARKKKIHTIFMEVSSISVEQCRIYGLEFDALVLTNFSQDHLDYHKTLEQYLFCKLIPFMKLSKKAYAVLNADEDTYAKFSKFTDANVITYGIKHPADVLGTYNHSTVHGISFYAKNKLYKSRLVGEFNVYNCLAVLALCQVYHISTDKFQDFLAKYSSVAGRMNVIEHKNRFILIDYAHTYSATKKVIEEAMRLCTGKLTIVLGCGGNREKEKRFMIGDLLNQVEARVILTTDNPRFEEPKQIINDILSTIKRPVECILDRTTAIQNGLDGLKEKDYLLVLGKGCEPYMDIKGIKYPYSDQEVIYEWISTH